MRRNKRPRAECFQFSLARASHVWVNLDRDRLDYLRLTPDQFVFRPKAQRRLAKLKTSASRWFDAVNERVRGLRVSLKSTLAHAVQTHLRRILVFDYQRDRPVRCVLNVDSHLGLSAHRKPAAKLSRDDDAFRKLAKARLSDRGAEQQYVVCERDPTQPRKLP